MNQPLFWRSLGAQALAVTVLFATLLALPLDRDFFRDWGVLIGPVAWAACSLGTARLLSLPTGLALFAALAGGVAGLLVGLVAGHGGGLVVSLLVFAASCAGYEGERDTAPVG
ncbi:MAG TPA: hypothetical protein VFD31_03055 [Thermoleophilaceae bacterium]|nr:hypothetical protein [Thermoleophilaceae bacterium]